MSVLKKITDGTREYFEFYCPGCKQTHLYYTKRKGPTWTFNGDMQAPTFQPSLLLLREEWTPPVTPENLDEWQKKQWPQVKVAKTCHLNITGGMIQFHGDCWHELKHKTIPMVPIPEDSPE